MSGKLAIGGLVAVAVMAVSAGTASAHPPGYGGGVVYGGGYAPVYRPVYTPVYAPVYRPVVPVYNSGFGYNYPAFGGYTSGFGFGTPNLYRGYGYGTGFGYGYGRPTLGLSFNFIR